MPAIAATTTWEPVDVTSAPFTDTLADGTVVDVSFGTGAGFWGTSHSPAIYQTDASAGRTTSTVRFSFVSPVTNLKTVYAYLGYGDELELSTNLGAVNLSQTVEQGGNRVSSTGGFVTGQPEGIYSNLGIVSATSTVFNQDNSAVLELSFPTGITYLEIRGAPSGPGTPGINLTGLSLPVTSYLVTFDPNGGSGELADQTIYADSQLVPNTFTRSGFLFTGWNTQADGKGTAYADEASVPSEDMTLFAQWSNTELAQTGFDPTSLGVLAFSVFGIGAAMIVVLRATRQ